MNWINNVVRPKLRSFLTTKRDVPDDLWKKCPETGQMVFHKDLEANQFVYPGSNYHERMSAPQRLAHTFDDGEFVKVALRPVVQDPLKFRDGKRYTDRLKESRAATGLEDAVLVGEGKIEGKIELIHTLEELLGRVPSEASQLKSTTLEELQKTVTELQSQLRSRMA